MNNIPQRPPKRSYALPIVILTFISMCIYYRLWPISTSWGLFALLIDFLLLGGIILSFILSALGDTQESRVVVCR
jgi:hypothetical protein